MAFTSSSSVVGLTNLILPQEKEEEEEEEEERRRIDAELKERLKGAFDDLDMEEEEEDESSYYGSPPPRISQDDMVTPGQQVPGRPWSHRASRYHDDMVTPGGAGTRTIWSHRARYGRAERDGVDNRL